MYALACKICIQGALWLTRQFTCVYRFASFNCSIHSLTDRPPTQLERQEWLHSMFHVHLSNLHLHSASTTTTHPISHRRRLAQTTTHVPKITPSLQPFHKGIVVIQIPYLYIPLHSHIPSPNQILNNQLQWRIRQTRIPQPPKIPKPSSMATS